jgi:hypothetical protein
MPILFARKVCFIHIPKTGGTTVERVLFDRFPEDFGLFFASDTFQKKLESPIHPAPHLHAKFTVQADALGMSATSPQHFTYADIETLCPDLEKWFSFAFIRNPWDRLYSEWKYARTITGTEELDFPQFVAKVETSLRQDRRTRNNHYRPQSDFIGPRVRLYRYERFAEEVRDVFAVLGIHPESLPHIYKTTEAGEYRGRYDRETQSRVARLYQEDIELFGYSF